mmetsp:Transcript_11962/g.26620  ORF Transcript_11962/g.26620 Transcript_11962/m.26620 type:complete len:214 (-) Transcript_11962:259-900(-)
MSATLADPQSILAFWFGDPALFNTVPHITTQMERWFMNKDPTVEVSFNEARDMIELLGQDEGLGEEWLTPKGTLARIVMLDQGSRTVFRATTQAFTHDPTALRLSLDLVQKGVFYTHFAAIERLMITMPMLHSEHMHAHDTAAGLYPLSADSPEDVQQMFKVMRGFLEDHSVVIGQFGRYPSRNGALGRESTAEEEAWLSSPDIPAWARSQMK